MGTTNTPRSYCQNWFSMMFRIFLKLTSDAFSGNSSWAWDPWQHSGPEEIAAGYRVTYPGICHAYSDTSGKLFFGVSASASASSNQAPTPPLRIDSLTLKPCCPTPARRPSPPPSPPHPTQDHSSGVCPCRDHVDDYKHQHNL